MISSIIDRELKKFDSSMNILLSRMEDRLLLAYLKIVFNNNCAVFTFESTYYGNIEPNIIICNNRISDLNKSIDMAKYFHCGLIIIDCDTKSDIVTNKINNNFDIHPVVQIALSNEIYNSWNKIHDYILDLNPNSIPKWQNTIYNVCKEKFIITNNSDKKV